MPCGSAGYMEAKALTAVWVPREVRDPPDGPPYPPSGDRNRTHKTLCLCMKMPRPYPVHSYRSEHEGNRVQGCHTPKKIAARARRTWAPGARAVVAWPGRSRGAQLQHHKGCFPLDHEDNKRPQDRRQRRRVRAKRNIRARRERLLRNGAPDIGRPSHSVDLLRLRRRNMSNCPTLDSSRIFLRVFEK